MEEGRVKVVKVWTGVWSRLRKWTGEGVEKGQVKPR